MEGPDERRYRTEDDVRTEDGLRPEGDTHPEAERPAVREGPRDDDRPVRRSRAEKGEHAAVVGLRLVDWVFYVLYGLLGLRFLLALLAASEEAGFTQLVHALTDPFLIPFQGIVASPGVGDSVVDFPVLVAIIAYLVLHLAIRGLIRTIGTASAPPRRE